MQAPDFFHARPRQLTRAEYDRMAQLGFFRGERVELIHGIVVRMSPIGPPHAEVVDRLMAALVRSLPSTVRVRIQQPFAAWDESEPEPDVAIVPERNYGSEHPAEAFLIIEVADSSLEYDRETKAELYAASNVAEYWVVDLAGHVVEICAKPINGKYTNVRRVGIDDDLRAEAFPVVAFPIRLLFD